MVKEFNLSSRQMVDYNSANAGKPKYFYKDEDVKEFIALLKKELKHEYDPLIFEKKLNKLSGDKLNG